MDKPQLTVYAQLDSAAPVRIDPNSTTRRGRAEARAAQLRPLYEPARVYVGEVVQ